MTARPAGEAEYALADTVLAAMEAALRTTDVETVRLVEEYLRQYPPEDQFSALDDLVQLTWRMNPAPIREFIVSPDYLGLADEAGRPYIYPRLLADLEELFDTSQQYVEAIFTGGIGYGKSTIATICHLYMLHQLGCLVNPARAFKLEPTSRLVLINLAINKTNAEQVVFHRVQDMVDRSPWFQKWMPRKREKLDHLEFVNNIWLAPFAASEKAVVGFDAFGGIMDEVNEMAYVFESTRKHRGEVVYDQAQTLRDAIMRRMTSRFAEVGSRLPGILVQISSAKYPGEYTERRIAQAIAGDRTIFYRQYTTWDTAPWKHSSVKFRLALGTAQSAPFIIENKVDEEKAETAQAEILEVPDNLRTAFETDIHSAIRDFAGRSTAALLPFITRVDKIFESFQRGKAAEFDHPFSVVESTLVDGAFQWAKFKKRLDPLGHYFAHGDLSKHKHQSGDRAAIAIGHIAGMKLITRVNEEGQEEKLLAPHFIIDLMIRIVAPPNDEIRISTVKGFFKSLKAKGMNFASITFDSWQSLSLIQDLHDDLVAPVVEELSVDKTNAPYNEFKTALYEDRLDMYDYLPAQEELIALEKNHKGKVDHPPQGSKDVADCLAAIVFQMALTKPVQRAIMERSWPFGETPEQERILRAKERKAMLEGTTPDAVRLTTDDLLFADADDEFER